MKLVATHYVIHDESTIHGMGETEEQAWEAARDFVGNEQVWAECEGLECSPATHNLAHGIGSDWTQWTSVGGVQCTLAEDEG